MSESGATISGKQPLIFITNDDGITAPGLRALVEAMLPLGDVWVIAPDKHMSGMGHAVTFTDILQLSPHDYGMGVQGAWDCSGTPVDCVKLGIAEVLHRKPDLLVSGINHGSNASINVIYSGTMSAAVEGAVESIPSIGFSLMDERLDAEFEAAGLVARKLASQVLKHGLPEGTCLNVNIPVGRPADLGDIKICRQAMGYWKDSFDRRDSPHGRPYYWMRGEFYNPDKGADTDIAALEAGHVSVVPIHFDMTAHHAIGQINQWGL